MFFFLLLLLLFSLRSIHTAWHSTHMHRHSYENNRLVWLDAESIQYFSKKDSSKMDEKHTCKMCDDDRDAIIAANLFSTSFLRFVVAAAAAVVFSSLLVQHTDTHTHTCTHIQEVWKNDRKTIEHMKEARKSNRHTHTPQYNLHNSTRPELIHIGSEHWKTTDFCGIFILFSLVSSSKVKSLVKSIQIRGNFSGRVKICQFSKLEILQSKCHEISFWKKKSHLRPVQIGGLFFTSLWRQKKNPNFGGHFKNYPEKWTIWVISSANSSKFSFFGEQNLKKIPAYAKETR